jgi:DNA gyrase/topoisomerase IV subunit A
MATTRGLLTVAELAAAKAILDQVGGLRDALHKLEYLTHLPELIAEEEAKAQVIEQQVLDNTQRLSELKFVMHQEETKIAQANTEYARLEAEIMRLQALFASENSRFEQLKLAKDVLRDELKKDIGGK